MRKFSDRHIGVPDLDEKSMKDYLGVESLEQLIQETIPDEIRSNKNLNLDSAISESQYSNHIYQLSQKNKYFKNYIGLGYNEAILPPVIQRNILENPGWYTAYTPYQAEVAQGRLEALLNYQTVICDLTGMQISNASLLDEGTSAAEAMTMLHGCRSRDQVKNRVNKFIVSSDVFEQTLLVLETRAEPLGIEIIVTEYDSIELNEEVFGCLVQYVGKTGKINDLEVISKKLNNSSTKLIIAADLMSLTLLKEPAVFNCDVVVGTSQRFGIPLGYGGPHAGYFATKTDYKRFIPGRIIGVSKDRNGNRALRMALQTREQHIKRERATSNICTAQVLLAVMAGMYAVYHGKDGLIEIGQKINNLTKTLDKKVKKIGVSQININYFDTLHFKFPVKKNKRNCIRK
jgi:glycine dehydrogenase